MKLWKKTPKTFEELQANWTTPAILELPYPPGIRGWNGPIIPEDAALQHALRRQQAQKPYVEFDRVGLIFEILAVMIATLGFLAVFALVLMTAAKIFGG